MMSEHNFNTNFTDAELKFLDQHTIRLQGKAYTQVNARVELFRKRNPYGQILMNREGNCMVCRVIVDGLVLAVAHKSISEFKKGGIDMGVEKAETGAIGRALAMVGIGTMTGELDEGDQIAESPVAKHTKPSKSAKSISSAVSKR